MDTIVHRLVTLYNSLVLSLRAYVPPSVEDIDMLDDIIKEMRGREEAKEEE